MVDDSTITGNDARLVGGIFSCNDNNNTLTVSNSTIAFNETTDEPGGPARLPAGGGLGVLGKFLLDVYPQAQVTVLERPEVAEIYANYERKVGR